MSAHVHSYCIPAYVEEVRKCFKEAYAEAHLQTNSKADQQKWYYDKRKVKDWWSKAEYVVACQVADEVPMYKMMMGMLRSSTIIGFSWWPRQDVMPHPWEEVSPL